MFIHKKCRNLVKRQLPVMSRVDRTEEIKPTAKEKQISTVKQIKKVEPIVEKAKEEIKEQ